MEGTIIFPVYIWGNRGLGKGPKTAKLIEGKNTWKPRLLFIHSAINICWTLRVLQPLCQVLMHIYAEWWVKQTQIHPLRRVQSTRGRWSHWTHNYPNSNCNMCQADQTALRESHKGNENSSLFRISFFLSLLLAQILPRYKSLPPPQNLSWSFLWKQLLLLSLITLSDLLEF